MGALPRSAGQLLRWYFTPGHWRTTWTRPTRYIPMCTPLGCVCGSWPFVRTRSGIYQSKRYDVNNGISVVNLCEGHFIRPMAPPPPSPINDTLNQIFEIEVIEKNNYLGTWTCHSKSWYSLSISNGWITLCISTIRWWRSLNREHGPTRCPAGRQWRSCPSTGLWCTPAGTPTLTTDQSSLR